MACVVDGVVDLEPIVHARLKVVVSVAGSGVYASGACLKVDIFSQDERDIPLVERMFRKRVFEGRALAGENRILQVEASRLYHGIFEALSYEVDLVPHFVESVVKARVYGHCHRSGKGPRRCGPNYDVNIFPRKFGKDLGRILVRVGHENRGRNLVRVFYLGRGERCFAVYAPVDGLAPFVDKPLVNHIRKALKLSGLVGGDKSNVGMFPVAYYSEALKLLGLHPYVFLRIGGAPFTKFDRTDVFPVNAHFLQDF